MLSRLIDVRRYIVVLEEKCKSGYTGLTSTPKMPAHPEPQNVTLLETMPHKWSQDEVAPGQGGP